MDEGGGEFHGKALGEIEGAGFPAAGGVDGVLGSFKELALGLGDGAGGVIAGDEEGCHVGGQNRRNGMLRNEGDCGVLDDEEET